MSSVLKVRIQDSVLCAMDHAKFSPPRLLRIRNAQIWALAKKHAAAFAVVGDLAFTTNVERVVVDLVGENCPHIALLVEVLTSATTIARFLLAGGNYEDVLPCPFSGMNEPVAVGEGFRVLIAAFLSASPKTAAMGLRLWTREAWTCLARAAASALSPSVNVGKPNTPTTSYHGRKISLVRPHESNAISAAPPEPQGNYHRVQSYCNFSSCFSHPQGSRRKPPPQNSYSADPTPYTALDRSGPGSPLPDEPSYILALA
ncbi:hypothetical protein C8R46DRAFT_1209745 [Mycena filopes]|nr:hypothetical protein C8R46DRAFT_1209745 [Mycena filopes]